MQTFELYTGSYDKKEITLILEDVKKVFKIDYDSLINLYNENKNNYYEDLSFNEYLYLCMQYEIKDDKLVRKYEKKINYIKSLVEYIGLKSKVIENNKKILMTVNMDMFNFIPNTSILFEMYKNIDKSYSKEERMFYYYFKLIHLLKIDTKVNFLKMANRPMASMYKKKFDRLDEIDPINNEVTCFEFTEILKYFIKQEKVLYSNYNLDNYGTDKHVYLDVISDNNYISFDAFTNDIPNDMINVKLGMKVRGINILSIDETIKDKINKVYEDVQKEFDLSEKQKYKSSNIKEIIYSIDNFNISSIYKEKAKKAVLELSKIPLNGIEYMIEALRKSGRFCSETIYPIAVCDTSNGYGFSLIISIKQKNGEYVYIRCNDLGIKICLKEEMEKMIENNELVVCNRRKIENNRIDMSYILIPGIDNKIQINGNLKAKKEILPNLINEISDNTENKYNKKM